MDSTKITDTFAIPEFGEVQIACNLSHDESLSLEKAIKNKLGFTVNFVPSIDDKIIFKARRLNLVNLGANPSCLTLLSSHRYNIQRALDRFVSSLLDIENNNKGDEFIDLTTEFGFEDVLCCMTHEIACFDADESEVYPEKHSKPKGVINAIKDWFSNDSVVTPPEDESDNIEALALAEEQRRELEEIKNLIINYVTKYHKDPSEFIEQQLRGKIVLNPHNASHLVVNGMTQIILPDYDETQIVMQARERTLYIFFLLHPEGLRQNEVCDYRKELLQIYGIVKPGASDTTAMACIDNLCNPFSDSLRQTISRIKKAVTHVIRSEDIAHDYYISGSPGERYRISLDREMVTLPSVFTNLSSLQSL